MGLSLGSLGPNRFIIKPTSAGPIIRNDRHMMKAITNARNAVIAQNTVGVIKPFFLQCLDIDAGATMQARRGAGGTTGPPTNPDSDRTRTAKCWNETGLECCAGKGELVAFQAHFLPLSRLLSSPPARGQGESCSDYEFAGR